MPFGKKVTSDNDIGKGVHMKKANSCRINPPIPSIFYQNLGKKKILCYCKIRKIPSYDSLLVFEQNLNLCTESFLLDLQIISTSFGNQCSVD